MNRTEILHNTREQVLEGVRAAVALADELELSDIDRAALLPHMLNQLTAKTINFEQPAPIAMGAMAIPRSRNGR